MDILSYLITDNRWCAPIGIAAVGFIGWLLSSSRAEIPWKRSTLLLTTQIILAYSMLNFSAGQSFVHFLSEGVTAVYRAAGAGIMFVFGALGDPGSPQGFIFGFHVLPIIIFFGALTNLLFYFGIIQAVVGVIHRVSAKVLGIGGPETACAIANSFLGQTDAPLMIRQYLPKLSRAALFVVMVSGMGTISGAILVVYAAIGIPIQHLLTAVVLAIPASLLIAGIMEPQKDTTHTTLSLDAGEPSRGLLHAFSQGTLEGLSLAANVGAMLISYIAILSLCDIMLHGIVASAQYAVQYLHGTFVIPQITVARILGFFGKPFAWLLGIRGDELEIAAELVGYKVAINEMVAFQELIKHSLSTRTIAVMTYMLCGFSNISSIGIQIGGIGVLAPKHAPLIAELGPRALLAAVLANFLSACIVALLL